MFGDEQPSNAAFLQRITSLAGMVAAGYDGLGMRHIVSGIEHIT